MPNNLSGVLTAKAVLSGSSYEVGDPVKIVIVTPGRDRPGQYQLLGDPRVQVATRPVGTDGVQLLWELNDMVPYDGSEYRSVTAIFTPHGQKEFLKDKTFSIHASTDGKTFTQIARVQGPTNTFLHKGIEPARLYYYKVQGFDSAGKLLAESPVTMGAAGKNLFSPKSLDELPAAADDADATVSTTLGARPYFEGKKPKKLVRLAPSRMIKQVSFSGNLIPISSDKTYLQGGWVHAPGNVWHGRYFYGSEKEAMSWGYSMPAVRETPEWTFGVQLLLPDKDGSGSRRKDDGSPYSMALKQWTFPTEAAYMTVFVTAFGPGHAADFWIIEINPPPKPSP